MEFNEDNFKALQTEVTSLKDKVKSANDEAKGHRLSAEAYRGQVEDFRGKWQTASSDLDNLRSAHTAELDKVKIESAAKETAAHKERDDAKSAAAQRLVDADLRFAAHKAGMVDLDGLKLLDRAGLKLDDKGDLTNADEVIAAMKTAKPYFFGEVPKPGTATGTTSSTTTAPAKGADQKFDARTASKEDYAKAKAEYLRTTR